MCPTKSGVCPGNVNQYATAQITVHPGFDLCTSEHDIAVIELTEDASDMLALPICMPSQEEEPSKILHILGYGIDPNFEKQFPGLKLATFEHYNQEDGTIVLLSNTSVGACKGDSGGPLFHFKESRHVLLGIASAAMKCKANKAQEESLAEEEEEPSSAPGLNFFPSTNEWSAYKGRC
ncbi:hypothetical protein OESDEN_15909 [Oesophagostomum dentatum]|uniref:Peptidase S1 domain-containing protein n=1 Tax=Oesophagostomum dentatum TaxID=61180 RepID=A0A0B1SHG9_OESDE|nr:hypothetical protein OESDEN_15909 [Oesophagostomum dentatum]